MTKKHYIETARIIRAEIDAHEGFPAQQAAIRNVAISIADMFAIDNPRFDRAKFLEACGVAS